MSGWTLSGARVADPIPVAVPSCVHTDLLAAGLIPDPFLDANETLVQWVADSDWTYGTTFTVPDDVRRHGNVDLVFEGLDTLATIVLNGTEIATTSNMHRTYRFDVGALLTDGDNNLRVTFRSATRYCDALRQSEGDWPSASFERPFNFLRKMACSWGWDWGPWLTTAGIWRPVALHGWTTNRLVAVRPTARVDDGEHGMVDVVIDTVGGGTVSVSLIDPDGAILAESQHEVTGGRIEVAIDGGTVRRWWPHTYGDQPLYTLEVALVHDGEVIDRWTRRIGFRTIELDTRPDANGSAFTFVINGSPIFARGVNWIPDDVFPSRITPERYRVRLAQAKAANVDMIRVWGGGIYEDDAFYEACDELGLMVWQDFLFACAAYPEHLLADEVEAEARDNVTRLMPHPSLVLWNGNNENIWGYFDWRWQERLQGHTWGAGFYFDLLPRVCAELDPARPYWPGSPYSGSLDVAPNSDANGCAHLWDVWNQVDFTRYRDHTPRFASEFGWQAPPSWQTLRTSISDAVLAPDSPGMAHHQKATDGDLKLNRGLAAHVGVPDDFDAWWFGTQLMQARAVATGIEHMRSLRGYCMGTIWWQLNDCWPVTSWSVIDGRGMPKPAWFALRDAYRPRLLTVQPRGAALVLFAINDSSEVWSLGGMVRRLRFDGTVLAEAEVSLAVQPLSIASVELSSDIGVPVDPTSEVLVADCAGVRAWWWFAPDHSSALVEPKLTATWERDGDVVAGTITTDVLVRDLTIYPDRLVAGAAIDRQLISLLPGEGTVVTISGLGPTDLANLLTTPFCWSAAALLCHVSGLAPTPL
ncbi:MAG: glycoside hydrolase family 2 protein [Ilumatobacteraceae bacterium]